MPLGGVIRCIGPPIFGCPETQKNSQTATSKKLLFFSLRGVYSGFRICQTGASFLFFSQPFWSFVSACFTLEEVELLFDYMWPISIYFTHVFLNHFLDDVMFQNSRRTSLSETCDSGTNHNITFTAELSGTGTEVL